MEGIDRGVRFGFAKARVEIQGHLDGTIQMFYNGRELPHKLIVPAMTAPPRIGPIIILGTVETLA